MRCLVLKSERRLLIPSIYQIIYAISSQISHISSLLYCLMFWPLPYNNPLLIEINLLAGSRISNFRCRIIPKFPACRRSLITRRYWSWELLLGINLVIRRRRLTTLIILRTFLQKNESETI